MVNKLMHKSPAKLLLFSLCIEGMLLIPANAQSGTPVNDLSPANTPVTASTSTYVPASKTSANVPASDAQANVPASSAATVADTTNYILGPEDQINVRVFAAEDIPDRPAQIANDGTVNLPMVGQVHAAGLTIDQFQAVLVTAYKKYFKDPQVTVQVTDFRSQPVSVAGNVNTPGVVQLRGNRNLMEVIGQAGGLRADAGDSVLITRNLNEGSIPVADAFTDPSGQYSVAHIDIRKIMSGQDPKGNILIKPHDVITVPRARMIYVLGNVNRAGGYVLTDNESMSITQAIALAGGWDRSAKLSGARVLRVSSGAAREQINADLKKIMQNKASDLQLRPDDILYVPNSFGKEMSSTAIQSAIGIGTGIAIWH
jgi:polysaccharide export outer membrane protein